MVCVGSFFWGSCLSTTEYRPCPSPVYVLPMGQCCAWWAAGSDPWAIGWGYNLKNRARPQPSFTCSFPIDKIFFFSPSLRSHCLHTGPALCTHVLSWRWAIHKPGTSRLPTSPGGLGSGSWDDGLIPQQKPASLCPCECHTLPGQV